MIFSTEATHPHCAAEQVAFVLLRLPTVASDLAVQLNTPTCVSAASAAAAHTGAGSLPTAASAPSLLLRVLPQSATGCTLRVALLAP